MNEKDEKKQSDFQKGIALVEAAGGTAEQAFGFLSNLADLGKEITRSKVEIRRIDAMENVLITKLTYQYDSYHKLLAATFAKRGIAIEKHFAVIDKGIKDNDRELILGGLHSLASIVKENPFTNFERFSADFDAGTLPPI
ncbi:MAG: hypothetical protein FWB78_04925 [Treponema sp.]|nr:hypothetical protein [Treponema sp.]